MQKRPYFMSNPEWYRFDEENWRYVLTDKATPMAKRSYNNFYATEKQMLFGQTETSDGTGNV